MKKNRNFEKVEIKKINFWSRMILMVDQNFDFDFPKFQIKNIFKIRTNKIALNL